MVILSGKLYKRLGLFTSAFVLAISGLIMVAPLYFSQIAHATTGAGVWSVNSSFLDDSSCNSTILQCRNIQTAIDAANSGDTIELGSNLTTTKQVILTKSVILDGKGYTITPSFLKTSTSNNSAIGIQADNVTINNLIEDGTSGTNLHGINVYMASGVKLNNVSVKNNDHDGLVVNGADVAVNNLVTSNNGWGGVDVDQGSGVNTPAVLTITGISAHSETAADIYVDNTLKNVKVNDINSQYGSRAIVFSPNDLVYKLKLAAPKALTPGNNSYTNNPSFDNTWASVDGAIKYEYEANYKLNGVSSYYFDKSNAGNYVLGGATIIRHNSGAPESTYSWRVRGIDIYGNVGLWSDYYNVTVDTTKPGKPSSLSFSTTDGTVLGCNKTISKNVVVAKWDASFDINFSNYEYKSFNPTTGWVWNGGNIGNVLSRAGALNGGDGTYGFAVRAVDKAGNVSDWTSENLTDSCKVTYDATAPVVAIVTPSDGNIIKGIVAVSGSIKDINPDHYYMVIKNSKGTVVAGPGTVYQSVVKDWSWNTASLPDGAYTIDLEARDAAGNKGVDSTKTIVVTVDNTAPVGGSLIMTTELNPNGIIISSPDKDGAYALPDLSMDGADVFGSLSVAVTDVNLNTTAKPIVYVDGIANGFMQYNAVTSVWDYAGQTSVPDFKAGTHNFTATFLDKAGNAKTLTAKFTTDNTAPVVAITSPTTYKFSDNATVDIEGTTDDAIGYKLFINGELADSGASFSGYKWNTTGIKSGDYLVRLEATDLAGNVGYKEITIAYTVSAPAVMPLRAATTNPTVATNPTVVQPEVAAADTNGEVLGDNTVTPSASTSTADETKTEVKGVVDTKTDTTWSILGLAWYWWLLILAAVGLIIWGVVSSAARRKEQ